MKLAVSAREELWGSAGMDMLVRITVIAGG
jgi:hypothetical protein